MNRKFKRTAFIRKLATLYTTVQ